MSENIAHYREFIEHLYTCLENAGDLVDISYCKENQHSNPRKITLCYYSYESNYAKASDATNNKELKNICDNLYKLLITNQTLPEIFIDCENEKYFFVTNPNLFVKAYLSFPTYTLDSLYDSFFYNFDITTLINGIYSDKKKLSLTIINDMTEYLLSKGLNNKEKDLSIIRSLLELAQDKFFLQNFREKIISSLEICYDLICKEDTNNKFVSTTQNVRQQLAKFVKQYENPSNYHLYKKFLPISINPKQNNNNHCSLFIEPEYIVKVIEINHSLLIANCNLLIDQNDIRNMLKDICEQMNNNKSIYGLLNIKLLDEFNCNEILLKIDSKSEKNITEKISVMFLKICEFYNDTILHNKEKIDKKVLLDKAISQIALSIDLEYDLSTQNALDKQRNSFKQKI